MAGKETCWQTLYQGSINTLSIPLRNKTSSLRASILPKTTATFRTLPSLPTTYLYLQFQKHSQLFPVAASTSSTRTASTTSAQVMTKASVTTPHVPTSTTKTIGTTKITTISRIKKSNQMRIPSPPTPKKSLTSMSSILTPILLNMINYMVIITSALPQIIPPPSPTTTIFPPKLQTLSMMHGNTTRSIESNTI